ncbi:MAG: glycosyl hydrolase family 18 protein [Synechocystis sp.]|nr:glycosyl hydrolase family 18 protein [Synechocystis sp.]
MSDVLFSVVQDWGTGFQGEIILTNTTGLLVENWTLTFTADFDITSLWNANLVSKIGNQYTIKCKDWNPDLDPGETISFGFNGTAANGTILEPSNYQLNGQGLGDGGGTTKPSLPTITVSDATVTEGDTGISYLTYTVTLDQASEGPVTVDFATADGTAIAGEDYQASSGTVTFAAGETSKTIQIAVIGDTIVEGSENLNLTLSNASGATIQKGQGTGTILNDDQTVITPGSDDVSVTFKVDSQWSGGFGGTITLTNTGTAAVDGWTLVFDSEFAITTLWNGAYSSPTPGSYEVTNLGWNNLIAPGASVSFGFNGNWSGGPVPDPTNYRFNGELLGSLPGLSVNDISLVEGDNGHQIAQFTVSLSAASEETVTVSYGTADGSAQTGSDYLATSGTLTFNPGETQKTIDVQVLGDMAYEGSESFSLTLTNATAAKITDGQGVATIVDNDPLPPGLQINDVAIAEGNDGVSYATLTVSLDSASGQQITVDYATANGSAQAGSDYLATSGTLTFNPGDLSQTITIAIQGDTVGESNESFRINLSNVSNALINDGQGLVTIQNDDVNTGNGGNYVVGAYYPEWAIYDRNFQVADIPADHLTHIFYAFAKIDENGEVAVFDNWAATQTTFGGKYTWDQSQQGLAGNFAELQALKAENPHLTNMISIGGWTLSGPFSDIALTDASREKFAVSAVEFMVKYGFDGIDIDWEYPVSGGLDSNVYRPEDTQNYTLLLGELREQLDLQAAIDGQDYQLTIASPAGFDKIANYDLAGMSQYLDFFNVMAYDYHGAWEKSTNHQAALYANPNDTSAYANEYTVSSTVQQYLDAGVAPEDIVLGAPSYGRSWTGVSDVNDGLFQSATGAGPGTWENGVFDYFDLYTKVNDPNSGYVRYWDEAAQVPYVYNQQLGVFSTYEDTQSLGAKLDYVQNLGLGGMFFWEASADLAVIHADSLIALTASQLGVV